MAKYYRLREHLASGAIAAKLEFCEPPSVTDRQLQLAHDPVYLRKIVEGELSEVEERRIGFPWSTQMVERSRRSVGGTLSAARVALKERIAINLAGGTHHAFAKSGQGYCVFNDTAVAARVLQSEGMVHRVLIVDCDVHQGNGTASIFAEDPSVFTFSMHATGNYPFRKYAADLDVALPDGTADQEYLDRLDRSLNLALKEARANLVFYIAGADPYEGDRLGKLRLTKPGLIARDRMVMSRCRDWGVPLAVAMGGGYARQISDIVEIHANTVAVALPLCSS
ncbi:MAG: histone deacetylase [Pirellulaceae bacterium]|nr:histone deacetylase [Pirellulaceae bacterium]